ncbi:hypothetical protein [Catalinimonas alkaloidigena]|nr:hypothetical protein [Catalinimonas alkaloidigena]
MNERKKAERTLVMSLTATDEGRMEREAEARFTKTQGIITALIGTFLALSLMAFSDEFEAPTFLYVAASVLVLYGVGQALRGVRQTKVARRTPAPVEADA